MGRLIDADLLKENIIKCLKPLEPEEGMIDVDVALVSTLMEIDKQPTAFDVDNIVEQLELEMKKAKDEVDRGRGLLIKEPFTPYMKSIEIVKGGGTE